MSFICEICKKIEEREIGFYQKRHEECWKIADKIKKGENFWKEGGG